LAVFAYNSERDKSNDVCPRSTKKISIWLGNARLKQAHEFCYLESLLTEYARSDKEIRKTNCNGKGGFHEKKRNITSDYTVPPKALKKAVKALV